METSATIAHDDRAELLASAPLLAGVDDDGIKAIARRVVEVEFPKDHVIARQGEVGTGFFLVAKGRVRVVRDGVTIAHIGPGDFFGELSVLDGHPRVAQVIADEVAGVGASGWMADFAEGPPPDAVLAGGGGFHCASQQMPSLAGAGSSS